MIENDGGTVRAVAWKELCPWLSIFRVFRLSIAFPAILLGAAAILLTAVGWGRLPWYSQPTRRLLRGSIPMPNAHGWRLPT